MIGVQLLLPEITQLLSVSHTSIGNLGEAWLAQKLQKRGYRVTIAHERGDLTVITPDGEILYVEVKTARANVQGRYAFTLYKQSKSGKVKADCRQTDFVALLCVMQSGAIVPFIVPTSILRTNKSTGITSNPRSYAGRLAQFRQRPSSISIH